MSDNRPVIAQGLFSYRIGGSERVGADLALELQRRGYEVVCFAFYDTDGPIRSELERSGIPCVDLDYTTRPRYVRRLTYQFEFWRFLRRRRVRFLIVHHATALVISGLAARLAGVEKVVMIEHGLHQLKERANYRRQAIRHCRFADVITGVDATIVDYFRDVMGVPSNRLRLIPNGARIPNDNPALRASMRQTLGVDSKFVILCVGRLEPEKDLGTLLEAIALMPNELITKTSVLIAGDGSRRETLERQCRELRLEDRITFLGARGDIPNLLAAADAFIMTSVTEGQPMALIEAMAAGLPCVATSVGGIPKLLEGGAGLLVPPSSPKDTAAALGRLMDSAHLRKDLPEKARLHVAAKHSIHAVVDEYLDALGLPTNASNVC